MADLKFVTELIDLLHQRVYHLRFDTHVAHVGLVSKSQSKDKPAQGAVAERNPTVDRGATPVALQQ